MEREGKSRVKFLFGFIIQLSPPSVVKGLSYVTCNDPSGVLRMKLGVRIDVTRVRVRGKEENHN